MNHYEVTFIVDPVLSGDEIKATENVYIEMLKNEGCSIVHIDEMGLKQLAYPINKKHSGIYYCVEFTSESGSIISKLELALRRDERIMRFLTIALDKYGVKYNEDKRAGKIGKVKKKVKGKTAEDEISSKAEVAPKADISTKAAPIVDEVLIPELSDDSEE
jgi:small subunit ribosomal protein S6